MSVKIIADSSCDMDQQMRNELGIEIVPLTIEVDDKHYRDDGSINIKQMLNDIAHCKNTPRTACPSPQEFMDKYTGEDSVFVVTLSSALSSTYESALLAKKMFIEKVGRKFIHVFDSLSASAGETLVSLKIVELLKKKCNEMEIVEKVNQYIKEMKTLVLLDNLDTLVKNGRINPIIAKVASVLNIKLILSDDDCGRLKLLDKARGYGKTFKRFIDIIGEVGRQIDEKVACIAHCNCLSKALEFKNELLRKYRFKDIIIVEMSALSSVYANQGGIVFAF